VRAQTLTRPWARGLTRGAARWAAVLGAAAALAACGSPGGAGTTLAAPSGAATTLTYYAFDIHNGTTDPGFISIPGTNPKSFAQGDELIINDQLTTTRKVNGGPIVGHDPGVCALTRTPRCVLTRRSANCVVTAGVRNGSLTIQGIVGFRSRQPEPAVLAVTDGTGSFDGAAGTISVSFAKDFKILIIRLK
jgi:Dirigent-like protein